MKIILSLVLVAAFLEGYARADDKIVDTCPDKVVVKDTVVHHQVDTVKQPCKPVVRPVRVCNCGGCNTCLRRRRHYGNIYDYRLLGLRRPIYDGYKGLDYGYGYGPYGGYLPYGGLRRSRYGYGDLYGRRYWDGYYGRGWGVHGRRLRRHRRRIVNKVIDLKHD